MRLGSSAAMSSTVSSAPEEEQEWSTWPRQGAPVDRRAWGTPKVRRSLAQNAGIVAIAFVFSRVLGLVREVVLANQFGTSEQLSAYVSAFRIPDLLFLVVMAGAFGSAFIPVFAGFVGEGAADDAWKLASVVLNMSGLLVVVIAAITWVFAPQVVATIVAPDASPATQELTIQCMRILLLSPVFLGFGIAAKGILEGQDLFTLPAFAPLIYNVATVAGALLLGPRFGVQGVAVGVVVGAIGFLLVQIPGLVQSGMHYRFSFDPSTRGLGEVARLLGPRLIGQAAFQLNFIAVTNLAWRTGEQSVSALNYAWQLLMLPHGVLALSVSTVILPTLSRLWQQDDVPAFRLTLLGAIKPLLFLSLPASVLLFAFRTSIVQTLFQTGAFSTESTALVAAPLAFLAAGLASYALVEALARAFYAMHDTKTPVMAGITIVVLNIVVGYALLGSMGYLGLALSLSLSTTVEAVVLAVVLYRRIGGFGGSAHFWLPRLLATTGITAAAAMALAQPLAEATTPGNGPRVQQIAIFLIASAAVGLVFVIAAWLFRIPELQAVLSQVSRRLPGVQSIQRRLSK